MAEEGGDAPDAQTQALLQGLGVMTDGWRDRLLAGSAADSRAFAAAVFTAFAGPPPEDGRCRACDLDVPGGDGGARRARLYRPAAANGPLPVVVFLHGGGWWLGGLDEYDTLMRHLAADSGAAFLSLDYRLAPEHGFPAGLDDAAAVLDWLPGAADGLGLASGRVALMGDSAGGNLAAVTAWLRRGKAPEIAGQWLIYPMTDVSRPHGDFPSRIACGDGDMFLTRGAIDVARAFYLGDRAGLAADPRVSPLAAGDLTGLPPTHFIVANCDPLRDEAHAYRDRIAAAGIETSWRCYAGAVHAFLSFGVLDVGRRARAELARDVHERLFGEG